MRINGMFMRLKKRHREREEYVYGKRLPTYRLAGKYLPDDREAIVLDVGAGDGSFGEHLRLGKKFRRFTLLDGNVETVEKLREKNSNVLLWTAPDRIPFEDRSVAFVHTSHMVEHLTLSVLSGFLVEVERVLAPGGVFVISTPMLWKGFYASRTHQRPYNPKVFRRLLCKQSKRATGETVSTSFEEVAFRYRYRVCDVYDGTLTSGVFWGSRFLAGELLIQAGRFLVKKAGFHMYEIDGYTLVLRKKR